MQASSPLLQLSQVEVRYGGIRAVQDLSIVVHEGEFVAMIGANGAGKTTTLSAISGLVKPSRGSIHFAGRDITHARPHQIARLGVSHVPEGRRVFSNLTVMENLELGAYSRRDGRRINQDFQHVFSLFPQLARRKSQPAGTLSGGEQQMLSIGRALMAHPRLLLLDEPSLGLAPFLVRDIFQTLRRINEEGTTILLVEQDAALALKMAQRGYVLESGRLALEDTASRLAQNDLVRRAYLGE